MAWIMNKKDLVSSLQNEQRSQELCEEVVNATFKLLSQMVNLDQGLDIEGIGILGAHERQGANRELPNKEGVLACNNLSIFFHPSFEVKEQVSKLVEDVPTD
jgi:nucleoid DNA-binding protein